MRIAYTALLLIFSGFVSGGALAQFAPISEIKNISEKFGAGSDARELRDFLESHRFIVSELLEGRWYIDGSISSYPTPSLTTGIESIDDCAQGYCRIFWGYKNQYPPLFSNVYGHTYRVLWLDLRGEVVLLNQDNSLWRGNK